MKGGWNQHGVGCRPGNRIEVLGYDFEGVCLRTEGDEAWLPIGVRTAIITTGADHVICCRGYTVAKFQIGLGKSRGYVIKGVIPRSVFRIFGDSLDYEISSREMGQLHKF